MLCSSDENRLRKRIETLQNWRLNGIRSLADGELFEAEKRKREAQQSGGKKGLYDAPGSGAAKIGGGKKRSAAEMEEERLAKARKETGAKGSSAAAAASASAAAAVPASSSSSVTPNPEWDVTKMPGNELLSPQERVLVSTLQLVPQHYLMLKERLIREVRRRDKRCRSRYAPCMLHADLCFLSLFLSLFSVFSVFALSLSLCSLPLSV